MSTAHSRQAGRTTRVLFACVTAALTLIAAEADAAGDVSATVDPQQVAQGQRLEYSISASVEGNHEISLTEDPDFGDAFQLVGTTNAPSFSMRNGRTHRSLTRTYQLRAVDEGEHTIEGPEVRIADSTSRPEPIEVRVRPRGAAPDRRKEQRGDDRREERAYIDHAISSEHAPYVGEQILLHYYLFADAFRFQIEPAPPDEPDLDDFWIEDLSSKLSGQRRTMRIDGRLMERANLRSYALFPMRSGKLDIEPLVLEAKTGGVLQGSDQVRLESEAIELDVQPLPANAPDSFYEGNVGQWDLQVEADHKRAKMGEGITLEVRVHGDGYLSRLEVPELPELDGASVRHRDDDIDRSVDASGVSGSRTHEYTVVAEREGKLTIPTIEFSYFDPEAESYETIRSEPIELTIRGGKAPSPGREEPTGGRDEGELEEEDDLVDSLVSRLEPPGASVSIEPAPTSIERTRTFWILLVLPILGGLLLWLEGPVRRLWARWRPGRRRGAAYRRALRLLDEAEEAESGERALELVREALGTYMVEVADIGAGDITEADLPERLESRGVDNDLASRFHQLLKGFSQARYSPDAATREARAAELCGECRSCLTQLEEGRRDHRWQPSRAALVLLAGLAAALAIGSPSPAQAADEVDALAERAAEAHNEGDRSKAAELWEEIGRDHPHSPEVLYNVGTALAFDDDFGTARLVLERTRLQAPLDERFEPNREIVEKIVQVNNAERARKSAKSQAIHEELFWWRTATSLPSGVFATIVLLLVWAAFGALLVRRFSSRRAITGAAGNLLVATVICLALVLGAWLARSQIIKHVQPGVVLTEEVSLHEGPSAHARMARTNQVLGPGTMVPISRERDGWVELSLSDDETVWARRDVIAPVHW